MCLFVDVDLQPVVLRTRVDGDLVAFVLAVVQDSRHDLFENDCSVKT
jgi:hypothetical protein